MNSKIENPQSRSTINRRDFFSRLIATTGTVATAQLFLRQSVFAGSNLSVSDKTGIQSGLVEYMNGNAKLSGYLSKPKRDGKFPAVIVVHENSGLDQHTRGVTQRLAAEGFIALAPDMLSRAGGTSVLGRPSRIKETIASMYASQVTSDLNAGVEYLRSHAGADRQNIASMGFCWGATQALQLAAKTDGLKAALVFYGSTSHETISSVRCPIYGFYGENDSRLVSALPKLSETAARHGKIFVPKVYSDAGHAFFNETNSMRHDAAASKQAWADMLAVLRQEL